MRLFNSKAAKTAVYFCHIPLLLFIFAMTMTTTNWTTETKLDRMVSCMVSILIAILIAILISYESFPLQINMYSHRDSVLDLVDYLILMKRPRTTDG